MVREFQPLEVIGINELRNAFVRFVYNSTQIQFSGVYCFNQKRQKLAKKILLKGIFPSTFKGEQEICPKGICQFKMYQYQIKIKIELPIEERL